jgi:DNA primase small subunit
MEEPAVATLTSPPAEEDYVMVEAGEVQGVEEDTKPAPEPASAQIDQDEDMGVEIKQEKKTELKLEDLFDGMDSDDDFPSSNNPLNIQAAA